MASLLDIAAGTIVGIADAVNIIPQIKHLGFESFQLNGGFGVERVEFASVAKQVRETIGDSAVISSIGYYGNLLENPKDVEIFAEYINHASLFGCDLVTGFAGAINGKSVPDAMPQFKTVWTDLARQAADLGIRIAFETCGMGGRWEAAHYNIAHAPRFFEMMWNELGDANLGVCWEPCHQLHSLVDPLPQLRKYAAAGKIFNVHGKDATIAWDIVREHGTRGGVRFGWDRLPGFGDTNWTDVMTILRTHGFKGSVDIEGYHDPVYGGDLEMTAQVHSLRYLKRCRGGDVMVPNPSK